MNAFRSCDERRAAPPSTPAWRPAALARIAVIAAAGAATLLGGCDRQDRRAARASVEALPSPSGPGAGQPFLATGAGGQVYLSWLEPAGDGETVLRLSSLQGDSWSEPVVVARGTDFFVNWADFPSVLPLPDGSLVAHWLVRSGPGTYAYDVHVARSPDAGRTWGAELVPHDDGTPTEHGFVSLFPEYDGPDIGAVWLDGREFHGAEEPEMTLRYARLVQVGDADLGVASEALLDGRVCDCCQTSVALADSGPVVAYRGRTGDELRDIHIVRRVDGRWSAPAPLHRDGWRIPACPVNGPALSARGSLVAAAWYTAADDLPRVQVAFSADGGATFGEPLRLDEGAPVGRVDLVLLEGGDALVSWLEDRGGGGEVLVRRVDAGGGRGDPIRVSATSAERASGFPRMAPAGGHVVFAWTIPGDPARIETGRLSLERL